MTTQNPFGTTITAQDVIEDLSFFDSWEDRYRYIIDLGKQLPDMEESLKTSDRLIPGCQSQVWLEANFDGTNLHFTVDSDAHIVRGLLAMVMAAFNNKTPQAICQFEIEQYFAKIDLIKHLSPTRGNGLQAMVNKILQVAEQQS
ncbi:MAG: SufE family protein [Gammaproteobacteria bacterium]|nr:SufE family protein [Gammaproteobacteria bacterium]NVK89132.1 SufE family protein [Gammaproteobacteria bacterium]